MGYMSTMPARIDGELFEAAKVAGALHSRSAAQQVTHWARLGRELEASGALSTSDVERVLAGLLSYDALGDDDQAVVRAEWRTRMDTRLANLDLVTEFVAAGEQWSELDDNGNIVTHG